MVLKVIKHSCSFNSFQDSVYFFQGPKGAPGVQGDDGERGKKVGFWFQKTLKYPNQNVQGEKKLSNRFVYILV